MGDGVWVNEDWTKIFVSGCQRRDQPIAQASLTPALRKLREERDTHYITDANEIKSLGGVA